MDFDIGDKVELVETQFGTLQVAGFGHDGTLVCQAVVNDNLMEWTFPAQWVVKVENPEEQLTRLGQWIVENIPGEPSQSEGAVDTAIRLLDSYSRIVHTVKKAHEEW